MSNLTNGHLITQDSDDATRNRTYWDLPGGGMDFGETIESSLKRELYEEVGYKGGLRYQLFDAS